jgi:hypothetical protein
MKNEKISKVAFWLSIISVVLSGLVSVLQMDIWLAGTQWMLIAIVLGIWALFLKE